MRNALLTAGHPVRALTAAKSPCFRGALPLRRASDRHGDAFCRVSKHPPSHFRARTFHAPSRSLQAERDAEEELCAVDKPQMLPTETGRSAGVEVKGTAEGTTGGEATAGGVNRQDRGGQAATAPTQTSKRACSAETQTAAAPEEPGGRLATGRTVGAGGAGGVGTAAKIVEDGGGRREKAATPARKTGKPRAGAGTSAGAGAGAAVGSAKKRAVVEEGGAGSTARGSGSSSTDTSASTAGSPVRRPKVRTSLADGGGAREAAAAAAAAAHTAGGVKSSSASKGASKAQGAATSRGAKKPKPRVGEGVDGPIVKAKKRTLTSGGSRRDEAPPLSSSKGGGSRQGEGARKVAKAASTQLHGTAAERSKGVGSGKVKPYAGAGASSARQEGHRLQEPAPRKKRKRTPPSMSTERPRTGRSGSE